MRLFLGLAMLVGMLSLSVFADDPIFPKPKKNDWYTKAVKKMTASVEPAEAKPGQTVTWKLTLELEPGYTTYPTLQADKNAASMVNKFIFPDPGTVVFVGDTIDPPKFKKKAEPDASILELRYYEGKVVYEQKLVVNPKATPGEVKIELPAFKLSVCDNNNCFPSRTLKPTTTLKVLAGPAVEVEAAFRAEVEKKLAPK
ncbi:MAG: hypothetical protein ACRC8S_07900 [Fimbriiglobus sp.]